MKTSGIVGIITEHQELFMQHGNMIFESGVELGTAFSGDTSRNFPLLSMIKSSLQHKRYNDNDSF